MADPGSSADLDSNDRCSSLGGDGFRLQRLNDCSSVHQYTLDQPIRQYPDFWERWAAWTVQRPRRQARQQDTPHRRTEASAPAKLQNRQAKRDAELKAIRDKMSAADQATFDQLQATATQQRTALQQAEQNLKTTTDQLRALIEKYQGTNSSGSGPSTTTPGSDTTTPSTGGGTSTTTGSSTST